MKEEGKKTVNGSKEKYIENRTESYLLENDIVCYKVLYTEAFSGTKDSRLLYISFFDWGGCKRFLDLIDYNSLCDKSEIIINKEYNLVNLVGNQLEKIIRNINEEL